jgi:hypothetical protein
LNRVHLGIILIRLGATSATEKAEIVSYTLLEHREKLINAFTVIQINAIRIRRQG